MHIKTLKLQNFRNYEDARFVLDPAVNLICGENGQGQDQPARGGGGLLDHAAVPHGAEEGRTAVRRGCGIHLLGIRGAGPREHTRAAPVAPQGDGDLQKRRAPEAAERRAGPAQDRAVLSGGSDARARRRRGGAFSTRRCVSCGRTTRAIWRNTTVCTSTRRASCATAKKNRLCCRCGRTFRCAWRASARRSSRYRAYYCRRLLAAAAAVYSDIAPHEALSGVYRTVSSVSDPFASAQQLERELIDHVFRHKNAEIAAKSCLSGPHKDDLELLLDGRSASAFASQGQVRTCTLSLASAERELFFEEDGEYPVLLLDDVLSELDRRRQDFVLNRISAGQVMITCCEDGISEKLRAGAAFHIKNGKSCISLRYTNARKCGIIK